MTDTSDEVVGRIMHHLTHGTVSNAVDADAAAMLSALLGERDLGRSRFNTALSRAQAAEVERDRLREALLLISTDNIPAEYASKSSGWRLIASRRASSGYRRFAAAVIGEAAHG
jgi:hypothetical protein